MEIFGKIWPSLILWELFNVSQRLTFSLVDNYESNCQQRTKKSSRRRDVLCANSEGADKSYTMIKKSSVRRWEQIPNWFIAHAPLPIFFSWYKSKAPAGAVCAAANCVTNSQLQGSAQKGSHRMGAGKIRWKSPRLSLYKDLLKDTTLSQLHLDEEYL